MRRAMLIIGVLTATGCTCAPAPCVSPAMSLARTPLIVSGEPYVGTVSLFTFCEPDSELRFRGGIVTDSQNTEVAAEWTLRRRDSTTVELVFRFTPQTAGPFHYIARAEPDFLVQGDLTPARVVPRTVLRELVVPDANRCSRSALMADGTFVCGNTASPALFRSPATTPFATVVAGLQWQVAGDALWGVADGKVTRWLVRDGGLVEAQQHRAAQGFTTLAAATETDGYGSEGVQLVHWFIDGGDLVTEPLGPSQPFEQTGWVGAVTPDGGAFWAAESLAGPCLFSTQPFVADGGVQCFPFVLGSGPFFEAQAGWSAGTGTLRRLGHDGSIRTALLPFIYNGPTTPLLRERGASGVTDFFLAVPDGEAGLAYERLPGQYLDGWVDGDKLLLMTESKVTVLQR